MRTLVTITLAVAAAAVIAAVPAQATFKGKNGLLVYQAQAGEHVQLFTVRPDGTGVRQLTNLTDSDAIQPIWSPDGRLLAFTRKWGPNKARLYTMRADGTGVRALDPTLRGMVGWFPDGRRLLVMRKLHWTIVTAAGTQPRDARIPGGGDSPCILPDGKGVAFMASLGRSDGKAAIFVGTVGGGHASLKRVSPWQTMTDKIDCSPDGSRIAFSAPATEAKQSTNVYSVGVDGTGLRQLTHSEDGSDNGVDSWSPDGTKIVFVSNRSGTFQLYAMNADGNGVRQITHGEEAHFASWGSHL